MCKMIRYNEVMIVIIDLVYRVVDFCFFKQKTSYEMRISDWSSDVCSSDLCAREPVDRGLRGATAGRHGPQQCSADIGKPRRDQLPVEIGRASCRERVCQYV